MQNPGVGGYAVANTEDEHKTLTGAGYLPPFVEKTDEREELFLALAAKNLKFDRRWGIDKLRAALEG